MVDQLWNSIDVPPDSNQFATPRDLHLTLSNSEVAETERLRIIAGGNIVDSAHPISRLLYDGGCFVLDFSVRQPSPFSDFGVWS